jgi:putative glycosyltransferase (TIGR04348 family)
LRICIVTPAGAHTRTGNRNTAARWAAFLRELGHRVSVEQTWSGASADMMIALHARRSHASIGAYAQAASGRPLVVVLTGTDVYRDIHHDDEAQQSLEIATRLIVLQDKAPAELPGRLRRKTRVVYQSARTIDAPRPLASCFEIVVSGHLREEKDPFRAAAALARLPAESRIRVTHIGGALDRRMQAEGISWMSREPRYRWLGELPHWKALRILARSRALVISSHMEGGANVVSEALASRVPVIASRIRGNIGMLGADYPGYYRTADERALAKLLWRTESDRAFYASLKCACRTRARLVTADRERAALASLISELTGANASASEPKERRFRRKT